MFCVFCLVEQGICKNIAEIETLNGSRMVEYIMPQGFGDLNKEPGARAG